MEDYDKKYGLKEGELLPKYDENGFATEPDYTCDMCGYPNEEHEVKYSEGSTGMCMCQSCYEEWLEENQD